MGNVKSKRTLDISSTPKKDGVAVKVKMATPPQPTFKDPEPRLTLFSIDQILTTLAPPILGWSLVLVIMWSIPRIDYVSPHRAGKRHFSVSIMLIMEI